MKSRALLCTSILVLLLSGVSSSQEREQAIPPLIAWPPLHVGMEKQEALRKMSSCCQKITEIGIQGSTDTAGIVLPRDPRVGDISGAVYFRGNKVAGIARDVSGSAAPEVYENGMALYRLLTSVTRGQPTAAMIRMTTVEATNATTRYITLSFTNGKQVKIEVSNPDPGQKNLVQSVVLSECEGTCADW
jgi:hypothetical protein